MKLSLDQIYALCLQHHFTPESAAIMAAIALAESGGDTLSDCIDCVPGVHEQSLGLYQINMLAWPNFSPECLHDPICATNAAYIVSNAGSNFSPWTQYKNGAYKAYYVPPGNIVTKGGQAVTPNPVIGVIPDGIKKALNEAVNHPGNIPGDVVNKALGGAVPSLSQDEMKQALITVALIGIASVLIMAGVYGLVMDKAKDVVMVAAKAGAI